MRQFSRIILCHPGAFRLALFLASLFVSAHASAADAPHGSVTVQDWRLALPTETPRGFMPYSSENQSAAYSLAIATDRAEEDAISGADALSGKAERRRLSTLKAIGLSTLVPGAGQWYAGRRGQARLFFGLEAANWITYGGLRVFADWRRDDFVEYAVQHAGVNPAGQDDEFFRLINFYQNRDDYNAIGRAFDPGAPYIPDTPETSWNWDSPESQATYRQLRNDFQSAERNAEFMFVTAAINRIVSAVFAWQSVRKHNNRARRDLDDEFGVMRAPRPTGYTSLRLERPVPGAPASDGLMLSYRRSF
ncbi:MAG: hypothetical protein ACE5GA_08350 [Candidatus Zixiibacteriota bacterium]